MVPQFHYITPELCRKTMHQYLLEEKSRLKYLNF